MFKGNKKSPLLVVLFTSLASNASAGGIERRGDASQILFSEGKNRLELSMMSARPSVSGETLPGVPAGPTGDIAGDYSSLSLGYKREISDKLDLAFIVDEPVGASISYLNPTAFFAGSNAEVSSVAYTALAKFRFNENFSVYGGLRYVGVDGDIRVQSPITVGSPYNLSVSKSYDVGYLVGAAYEVPDIALRLAVTYESETSHEFSDNSNTPFDVALPQAVTLHFQTGISQNTLVFGSARWREWTKFRVQPSDFLTAVPGVGLVNNPIAGGTSDIWTYEVGMGHRFSDNWSGAVTVGYEKDLGDVVGNFSGTDGYFSYGAAITYEAAAWEITTGVRFANIGSADSSVTRFSNNDAFVAGVKVSLKF